MFRGDAWPWKFSNYGVKYFTGSRVWPIPAGLSTGYLGASDSLVGLFAFADLLARYFSEWHWPNKITRHLADMD